MTLFAQQGVITAPTVNGTDTVLSGLTDPKAIILWTVRQASAGAVDTDGQMYIGYATFNGGAVQQVYNAWFSADVVATSDTARGYDTTACLKGFSSAVPAIDFELRLVSMDATSITLDWFDAPAAAIKVHYLVLGGSDLTAARCGQFSMLTSSPQDVTVVAGFGQPDLLFFTSGGSSVANGDAASDMQVSLGWAKSDTERMASSFMENDAATTVDCYHWQKARAFVDVTSAGVADSESDLSARGGWPTDGFELTHTDLPAGAVIVNYLALKGTFKSAISAASNPTGAPTQVQNLAAGFAGAAIRAAIVFGGALPSGTAIDSTHADLGMIGFGATDGTNEGFCCTVQNDGGTDSFTGVVHSETKAWADYISPGAAGVPTILAEADSSFSGDNCVLTWNDTDATAREFAYVVLGDGVSSGDPAVDTNATIAVGEDFRVRFELQELTGGIDALPGLHLYASKNGGAYARVTAATDLRSVTTSTFADGDATTNLMTGSTGTFVAGAGDEDAAVGAITIGANGHTEVEWSLRIVTASDADTFDLRVYRSTGVALDSYGATPRITADLVATDPSIGLSPASLSFNATEGGSDPADKSVTITNTGAGTLAWSVSDDAAWLTCTPTFGSLVAPDSEVLTVSPATGVLAVGTYNATITITDTLATNSPQTVPVTFNVVAVGGFPVAMDGVYFETSGFAGPIIDANGNLYIDTEAPNSVPTTQEQEENHIQKSTDRGHSWIYDVDGANSPTQRDLESLSTVLDANGMLHAAWQGSGSDTYSVYYAQFRTSAHATNPDTWTGGIGETIKTGQSGIADQSVSLAVRSDGSVVAFYIATNRDLAYKIRSTGGTWGSEVIVISAFDVQQVFCELSKQDNTVHFAYGDYTNKLIYYNTLSPTDVLGTTQQIASGVYTNYKPMANRGLVVYDNAGVDHAYVAWVRASDSKLVGVEITAGTPGATVDISDVAVYLNPANILSNQPVAAIAYDQVTGTIHAVWADNATHDMWRSERALGEAWTAPEEIYDAVDCDGISCNVIQYPSGGAKTLGLYYDIDIGIPSGGQMYYSEVLLVAGTADTVANSDTFGLDNEVSNWSPTGHHRAWWNSYQQQWDALIPAGVPPAATQSDWWLVSDVTGEQAYRLLVEDRFDARPDIVWDDAAKKLYVFLAHDTAGKFSSYDYNSATDTYTIDVGLIATGINAENTTGGSGLWQTPNGYLWTAGNNGGFLKVNRSIDGGATWGTPVSVKAITGQGKTAITHFVNGGTTYVAVACGEDGLTVGAKNHFVFIDQAAAGWGTAGNWTDDTTNMPAFTADYRADDEMSITRDANNNVYLCFETEPVASRATLTTNGDPQWALWKRTPTGTWSATTIAAYTNTAADDRKRPGVTFDNSNNEIYVFACHSDQTVAVYRKAPLASLGDLTSAGDTTVFGSGGSYRNIMVPREGSGQSDLLVLGEEQVTDVIQWVVLPIVGSPALTGTTVGTGAVTGALTITQPFTGTVAGVGTSPSTLTIRPQTLSPSADSVDGAWTDDVGGTALVVAIDEAIASDADYARSEDTPSLSSCRVKLATGGDPVSSVEHVIRWRVGVGIGDGFLIDFPTSDTYPASDTYPGSAVPPIAARVQLRQGGGNAVGGGTLIAEFTRSSIGTLQTFAETLSGAEADAITDYSDLYLDFRANQT